MPTYLSRLSRNSLATVAIARTAVDKFKTDFLPFYFNRTNYEYLLARMKISPTFDFYCSKYSSISIYFVIPLQYSRRLNLQLLFVAVYSNLELIQVSTWEITNGENLKLGPGYEPTVLTLYRSCFIFLQRAFFPHFLPPHSPMKKSLILFRVDG